jgi:predicted outer membrane repeat protein
VEGNNAGIRISGGNPMSVGIGGGVATFLSRVDVDRSTVSGNSSSEDGGGISGPAHTK